jgi:hypothetical protein
MILVASNVVLSMTCSILVYYAMVREDYPAATAIAVLGICLTNAVSGLRYRNCSKSEPEMPPLEPPVRRVHTWSGSKEEE